MSFHKSRSQEQTQQHLSVPLTHTVVPPVQLPRTPEPLWPWLYSALLGNGRLLVCLDEMGSIAQLFYPSVDAGPHVRTFLMGIQVIQPDGAEIGTGSLESDQRFSWLAGEEWTHELRYVDSAAVVHCISSNAALGVQVEQVLAVDPDMDVLMNDIKVMNLSNTSVVYKLVTYAGFDFDYRQSGSTCYFDVENSLLTFFSFDRYVGITCTAPVDGFGCDKTSLGELDHVFLDATRGSFNGHEYAAGQVRGAVCYDFGEVAQGCSATYRMNICFDRSLEAIVKLSSVVAELASSIDKTTQWWQNKIAHSRLRVGSATVRNIYDRSLITFRLLTDSTTGGTIASPECDPDFRSCDGYGYCWPRDGAFIGYACDGAGEHELARMFCNWALRAQSASGDWYQRYYVHGELAPTWGLQFDQNGVVVWAICRHIQCTGDIAYGQEIFPQLVRACEYMRRELDLETGLAPVTKDLWEERNGISTYACACTWAGFHELAELSLKLGDTTEAERWVSAAADLKAAIEAHLWDGPRARFLHGMKTKLSFEDVERLRHQPGFLESDVEEITSAGKFRYLYRRDAIVDASLLGLSVPFGVFSPGDPRMVATAEAVASNLTSPVGGICRYQGDLYRGGNPWIICTLWLALQDLASGQKERACALYNWVLEHRTSLDLFPEQVDHTTGKPAWVIPLAWSHAMFLVVTQALIEHNLL